MVRELGPDVTAEQVIDRVTAAATTITDNAAACVIAAAEGPGIVRSRVELLEISRARSCADRCCASSSTPAESACRASERPSAMRASSRAARAGRSSR